jgi:hypothetical protein
MTIDANIEIWQFVSRYDINGLIDCQGTSIHVGHNTSTLNNIYPNPSSGLFTVTVTNQTNNQASLFDALGKLVATSNEVGTFNIDLSDMPVGIYTLRLDTESGTVTKKLVRE